MKILQVNNVYGEKSTGKLTRQLHEGLQERGHEALAVFGRGSGVPSEQVIRLCPEWYGKVNAALSRLTGMPYGGCLFSTARLKNIIRRYQPDVVHLQCINGNFVNIYSLIRWLNRHKIATVVSLHAEFMYTGNCGHAFECDRWKQGCGHCPDPKKANHSWFLDRTAASWRRMYKAFQGFENCVVCPVSPWTSQRNAQGKMLEGIRSFTVLNGVDDTFCYASAEKKNQILHVTAQFDPDPQHPKGGWYLLELAKRMPEYQFLVAGNAVSVENLPENVTLLGQIRNQSELAQLYRTSRLSLVLSRRETFSMPCAESLCCGTPVAGFKAGAPEQISLPDYSEFVEFGDIEGLEQAMTSMLAADHCPEEISKVAAAAYSTHTMVQGFLEVYQCLTDSKK